MSNYNEILKYQETYENMDYIEQQQGRLEMPDRSLISRNKPFERIPDGHDEGLGIVRFIESEINGDTLDLTGEVRLMDFFIPSTTDDTFNDRLIATSMIGELIGVDEVRTKEDITKFMEEYDKEESEILKYNDSMDDSTISDKKALESIPDEILNDLSNNKIIKLEIFKDKSGKFIDYDERKSILVYLPQIYWIYDLRETGMLYSMDMDALYFQYPDPKSPIIEDRDRSYEKYKEQKRLIPSQKRLNLAYALSKNEHEHDMTQYIGKLLLEQLGAKKPKSKKSKPKFKKPKSKKSKPKSKKSKPKSKKSKPKSKTLKK